MKVWEGKPVIGFLLTQGLLRSQLQQQNKAKYFSDPLHLQSSMNFFSAFRFNLDSGPSNIIMFLLLLLLPTNKGTVMFLHLCTILFGCLCTEGGLCLEESLRGLSRGVSVRETPCMVKSRQYTSYWNGFLLRESIPVGCVPSMAVAVGGVCLGGVYPSMHWDRHPPPPWTEFLTHACENIIATTA